MKSKAKIILCAFLGLNSLIFSLHAAETAGMKSMNQTMPAEKINIERDIYIGKFVELADEAWTEVLKEKIKEHIRKESTNMDKFAKLVAEANYERWRKKIEDRELGNVNDILETYIKQAGATDIDSPYKKY